MRDASGLPSDALSGMLSLLHAPTPPECWLDERLSTGMSSLPAAARSADFGLVQEAARSRYSILASPTDIERASEGAGLGDSRKIWELLLLHWYTAQLLSLECEFSIHLQKQRLSLCVVLHVN